MEKNKRCCSDTKIVLLRKPCSLLLLYQNGISRITFRNKETGVVVVIPKRYYFQTISDPTMNPCFCEQYQKGISLKVRVLCCCDTLLEFPKSYYPLKSIVVAVVPKWYYFKTVFYFAFIPQCYYHNRITFKKKQSLLQ